MLYIGVLSGTSIDAIDVAIVDIHDDQTLHLLDYHPTAFPQDLQIKLRQLAHAKDDTVAAVAVTAHALAHVFADAINQIIKINKLTRQDIVAIGLHGQTIRHHAGTPTYSIQIADPNIVAEATGITTIADFRRRDIAAGGQGAPLAPLLHHTLILSHHVDHALVNIGGIANISCLDNEGRLIGFDTGPGNTLLDAWARLHLQKPFDDKGAYAESGNVNIELLNSLLNEAYFSKSYPKSCGLEQFNLTWLKRYINETLSPADIAATLTALTAQTIADSIYRYPHIKTVVLCGGGTHNHHLVSLLAKQLSNHRLTMAEDYGINSDAMEAMLFAWLAYRYIEKIPSLITGSCDTLRVLGAGYY